MPKEPQQDMRGVLFKDHKHDKIDYSGSATIGGREYWISGWEKESRGGIIYQTLSFKPKTPEPSAQQVAPDIQFPKAKKQSPKNIAPNDDDIPF